MQLTLKSFLCFDDGYNFQVEDDCNLNSGEEIATSVNQMLARMQVEASFFQT